MRLLHSADWHIGDFPGPTQDGQNARALDTLRCIDTLIDRAGALNIDLSVVAGDVFHAARTWSDRGIHEVEIAATRIAALAKIAPVIVLRGTPNHDGAKHFDMLKQFFSGNPDVHILTEPGSHMIATRSGETVCVCALPGFDRGYWRAHNPGIDRENENVELSENLDKMVVGMRAMCERSIPCVLVGHYTVDGCNTESGQTMMFSQFEPVVSRRALEVANYDLCLFGHIHRPQDLGGHTFYSGAVNAFNFNDENQPRGFYVHDLVPDGVTSDMHELPARKFKTIRLDGRDVEDFNLSGMLPFYDVDGAIVRVLYNCTDEANRGFNRAQMERYLYDNGAFWVQEITPEKITITVSKKAMSSENDPETNLRTYLLENGTDLEDIEAMMPLAREIIDVVMAKGRATKPHGLFVPVEIDVTNYRNYRQETFSFDDVRFCTVNGQNGVGKSSLFMDAIYDALFEEPREGDLTGWICNDERVKSGAIKFTFRVGEKVFRVARTRVKSGKATLNLSEYVDGQWVDRSREKLRDTQTEIERTIGMDGMTLRACALIMQDQYGLFLQADKESRMKILSDILGLGIYDEMEDVATEKSADANRLVRQLQVRKDDLSARMPDVDNVKAKIAVEDSSITALDASIESTRKQLEESSLALGNLESAKKRADALAVEIDAIATKGRSLRLSLDQHRAAFDSAKGVVSSEREIMDGVERYHSAVAARDALLKKKAEHDALLSNLANTKAALKDAGDTARFVKGLREQAVLNAERVSSTLSMEADLRAKHEEYQRLGDEIKAAHAKRDAYREADKALSEASHKLEAVRQEYRAAFTLRRTQIADLQRRASLLIDSGCPVLESATCKFLKDAVEAQSQIEPAVREHENKTEQAKKVVADGEVNISALRATRDAAAVPDDAITRLEASRQALAASATAYLGLEKLRGELEERRRSIEQFDIQITALIEKSATLNADQVAIETKLIPMSGIVAACSKASDEVTASAHYIERERGLLIAKERLASTSARIKEIQADVDDLDKQAIDKKERLAGELVLSTGIDQVRQSVSALSDQISALNGERDRHMAVKGGLANDLLQAEQIATDMLSLSTEIAAESRIAAFCDALKRAFSNNGIPHSIVRSVVPLLEATASNILGQMTGGKMSVELVTEKVMKSNNKKEVVTLDIIISDADTGRLPYLSRSGGERVKVALSVILALAEVKSADAGVQIGFIAIDEPPFLDSQGVQSYCEAVENIQGRYPDKKVMIITHDKEMSARFPQAIYVFKDEGGSHASLE
ncbi:MAG: metallophosphoesterase [Alphaproteobacteria bacterium]|nr:metallophosphoesterase [Alphaproteobacteria bacterium]